MKNPGFPTMMKKPCLGMAFWVIILTAFFLTNGYLQAKSIDEYKTLLQSAYARGDYQKVFEIGRQLAKEHPDYPGGYYSMMILVSKTSPKNEKDLADVEWAVNTFMRKKFTGYDSSSFTMVRRAVYEEKSKFAAEKGNFTEAISLLKKIKSFGDAGSVFYSDLFVSMAYISKYLESGSANDAKAARQHAYSALQNRIGLKEIEGESNMLQAQLNFIIGAMDNDTGHYADAVKFLETAYKLDNLNSHIRDALHTAKENLKDGNMKFLSLKDIFENIKLKR
jgi:tetratricopeptide (TPR) repeat protein